MTTKANFPVTAGSIVVPYGHVIGNEKWRGSELAQRLQGKVRVIFEDALGLVDFHLSNRTCILLISEADLVAGDEFKRRLVRFRNASSLRGIVIVEKTPISGQYYLGVQKLVVLELGMVLLPVANQGEASQLIIQLIKLCKLPWTEVCILHLSGTNKNQASCLFQHLCFNTEEQSACLLWSSRKKTPYEYVHSNFSGTGNMLGVFKKLAYTVLE
ncbi:Fanconi anemia core complex-associated protein 24 isoform X2 [Vidua macroura]|uniref:Fanconi anemia core complex-associated protein 24 isoform X2 n=1 Tax=Vidua macroura TaxID=187451 RepID=UPI0023A880B9|nr:Fanconi anemia core complex-associated protein 24 isoform X2 [Vidua macroura]